MKRNFSHHPLGYQLGPVRPSVSTPAIQFFCLQFHSLTMGLSSVKRLLFILIAITLETSLVFPFLAVPSIHHQQPLCEKGDAKAMKIGEEKEKSTRPIGCDGEKDLLLLLLVLLLIPTTIYNHSSTTEITRYPTLCREERAAVIAALVVEIPIFGFW